MRNDQDNAVTSTTVTVKPVSINGNNVECDITGAEVIDDAIFLAQDQGYDIALRLDPGATGLKFHGTKPFCIQRGKCPPELPGGNVHTPFSVTPNSDTVITVHVLPVKGRAVAHYRLNFHNGSSCDPIIIHE